MRQRDPRPSTPRLPLTTWSLSALLAVSCITPGIAQEDPATNRQPPSTARGWLQWRGPNQNGTSDEQGLPATVSVDGPHSWTYDVRGRGTPVVNNGRLYAMAYEGEGADLQEMLICLDANTGKKVWAHQFTDFITDVIYYRFAIGSPTIDQESGHIYCMSTAGLLNCFSPAGKLLWQRSMMSEYGRLTFPNGRTGAPLIVDDLCIVHVISAGWGRDFGPARDRFFAFDKRSGENIWSCTPGGPPKDSSFSFPVVDTVDGQRLLYAGLGGGHMVCVDVRTGEPQWRFQMSIGGVNSSALLYKNSLIATHGKENIDDSTIGRMIAIKRGARAGADGPAIITKTHELWRNPKQVAFTSSPVLAGNRVYQTVLTGELYCVDADSGEDLWHTKLAASQIHASPAWGDGKLYVPMNDGTFHILRPSDKGAEELQKLQLEGNCLGAPAIADGRIFVHTTTRLYALAGAEKPKRGRILDPVIVKRPEAGPPVRLQVVPADFVTMPGREIKVHVRALDAKGLVASEHVADAEWSPMPGPGVSYDRRGLLKLSADAKPTATTLTVSKGPLKGTMRLRIVPRVPFSDDFEDAKGTRPRAWWMGAGPKWAITELDGSKVLAKTLDNPLFQRTMNLIGHPEQRNYTMEVDIRTDGNRRIRSSGGVVNQRYLIVLKGNHQSLEISSTMELLKKSVRYRWKTKTWYRLKTRVDIHEDGTTGTIRAKVWPRDEAEPKAWTLEVTHNNAHQQGAPGIYGFAPQSRFSVYLDNLKVTPND